MLLPTQFIPPLLTPLAYQCPHIDLPVYFLLDLLPLRHYTTIAIALGSIAAQLVNYTDLPALSCPFTQRYALVPIPATPYPRFLDPFSLNYHFCCWIELPRHQAPSLRNRIIRARPICITLRFEVTTLFGWDWMSAYTRQLASWWFAWEWEWGSFVRDWMWG